MPPPLTFMVDTIGADADRLPLHLPMYAGYVSGANGVSWTEAQFAHFFPSKILRYYQGLGPVPPVHTFDALDVEPGAVTPQEAAVIVRERVSGGIAWTTIYGGDATLEQTAADIQAMGAQWWYGHVNCILADWNLDEGQASALIGTFRHGMTVVGVQYASPSSNPTTFIPGTNLTLSAMNADLSIVDANWVPSGDFTFPPPPAPAPAPVGIEGVVVELMTGLPVNVVSTDNKTTWHNR